MSLSRELVKDWLGFDSIWWSWEMFCLFEVGHVTSSTVAYPFFNEPVHIAVRLLSSQVNLEINEKPEIQFFIIDVQDLPVVRLEPLSVYVDSDKFLAA